MFYNSNVFFKFNNAGKWIIELFFLKNCDWLVFKFSVKRMFNFLDSNLAPKVVCKTPSTDNYEVDNLISSNYTDKIRGFISYPSIKPPVEIEFEFLCSVNIDYIVLNTTVGSQRCSGIELYAKTNDSDYMSIGKCLYDNPGIVFCNSKKYSKTKLPPKLNKDFQLIFFKYNTFKYFLCATSIKILIFRTNKSVPCIGSVEVWGSPSKLCSQKTVDTIKRLSSKTNNSLQVLNTDKNEKDEDFLIPDDFKDDLTCEIMTIPMTLPSGKTVDESTLEKHIQNEKSFGRKPCDPFTGVKFSRNIKPVINTALKSRIDMFILQNLHRKEFVNIKRTLGGCSGNRTNTFAESSTSKRIFENDDTDNLDQAIAEAKKCKHFVTFRSEENDRTVCIICKIERNCLYKLPCSHFYCRSCLLKVCDSLKCSNCDQCFVKNDVEKCNL